MDPLRRGAKKVRKAPGAAAYLAPYVAATRRHGPSFEATLWASKDGQQQRFRVMTEMVDFTGRVLVDAGSGCGDLARYLLERRIHCARYIGLEGVEDVVNGARAVAPPGAEFVHADFVSDHGLFARVAPEVVVFSGSLNTLEQREALAVLDRAWDALARAPAGRTLVFNFLSDRCSDALRARSARPARRFDTLAMLDWAFERATDVRFRQDYLPDGHDATIAMSMESARG